ncbi:MAG: hypothetical protein L0H15_10375 [Nitrosospira sp.]|nr:hypothetical protein [Nitrosospira sp.]
MNNQVNAAVEESPELKMRVNVGERHRVMRSDVTRGSLWVTPRVSCYCVSPTGEVETLLYSFLYSNFGTETGLDQNRKYWNIAKFQDVKSIIRRFGEM